MIGETLGCAILDTGCSKTVCSKVWLDEYLETLDEKQKLDVQYEKSNTHFRFGDGSIHQAIQKVKMPAQIGKRRILINADVIENEIPLLLSKEAMRKAGTIIDLKNDEVFMFGNKVKLFLIKSGHYCIGLNPKVDVGKDGDSLKYVFISNINKINESTIEEKKKIAMKLHKQFCHPSGERLCKLLKNANVKDDEMIKIVYGIQDECTICKRYSKSPPRPIVSLPRASDFNESVAMDLKVIDSKLILHIIDHFTRYSAGCVIPSKRKEVIIASVLKIWISIFGTPKQFLSDNGLEFNNEDYKEMAEKLNTKVKTTAAESP